MSRSLGVGLVGQTLGDYRIESRIGAGAMGEVYKATHVPTGRAVAIKTIPNDSAKGNAGERFKREAQILAHFKHPNIVRFYYAARDKETKVLYLAMELIVGSTLDVEEVRRKELKEPADLDREGVFSWRETVELAIQFCDALHYAHQSGVVHRDLKPSNLMITREGRVKLTDFGIAKDLDATALTATGRTLGTVAYMAPEQIRGSHEISHKTDLYALGAVLYEMLTGETPFQANSPIAMMHLHANEPPPRASAKVEEVPVELDELILRLMAKEPADRPWDAAAVGLILKELKDAAEAGQAVAMVHDPATHAKMPRRVDTTVRVKTKGKKKNLFARTWEQYREIGITVGLVAALIACVGVGFRLSRGPSAQTLFDRTKTIMASADPLEWEHAREMIDDLEQRQDNPDPKQTTAWRGELDWASAERRAKYLGSGKIWQPKNAVEERYVTASKLADAAQERGDEVAASALWREFAGSLPADQSETRGWHLLAERRAEKLEAKVRERAEKLQARLADIDREIRDGHTEAALDRWKLVLSDFRKFPDLQPALAAAERHLVEVGLPLDKLVEGQPPQPSNP